MDEPTRYLSAPLAPMHLRCPLPLFLLTIRLDGELGAWGREVRDALQRQRLLPWSARGEFPRPQVSLERIPFLPQHRVGDRIGGLSPVDIDRLHEPTVAESWAEWVRVTGCS